jgi:hypothetical protein
MTILARLARDRGLNASTMDATTRRNLSNGLGSSFGASLKLDTRIWLYLTSTTDFLAYMPLCGILMNNLNSSWGISKGSSIKSMMTEATMKNPEDFLVIAATSLSDGQGPTMLCRFR